MLPREPVEEMQSLTQLTSQMAIEPVQFLTRKKSCTGDTSRCTNAAHLRKHFEARSLTNRVRAWIQVVYLRVTICEREKYHQSSKNQIVSMRRRQEDQGFTCRWGRRGRLRRVTPTINTKIDSRNRAGYAGTST